MKFGTSGLRGLATDLVGKTAGLYSTAFGQYILEAGYSKPGDEILIGRDFRSSSQEIALNCASALSTIGFRVLDCGNVPTPALALYGQKRGCASLMITGSHIPGDRNGIKFYRTDGEIDKTDETHITRIANQLIESDYSFEASDVESDDHEEKCKAMFRARNFGFVSNVALSGLKIGIYQHSTVARDLLVDVLRGHGAEVVELGRSSVFIPVDTEAVSNETIAHLKRWALEHQLHAIVSADGDGDRPLVADENGIPLRGDLLGLLAAKFLDANVVVTPVTSNSGIEGTGSFDVVRTKVGSPFVIAGMLAAVASDNDRVMGFEANGGLLLATDFVSDNKLIEALPTRDSFLPILIALVLVARMREPLSVVASRVELPFAAADRLENFPVTQSNQLMSFLRASAGNLSQFLSPIGQVISCSDVDGLRVELDNRRVVHLRPSGNAPEMRCYVEAGNRREAEELLQAGLNRIMSWRNPT